MDERIDALQRRGAADPGTIALGAGLPAAELFPRVALAAAVGRVLRREGDLALQYGWPEGRDGLRDWIAARLRARGADVTAQDVIVTSGAQQALAVASQVLLGPGRAVAADAESYPGALDVIRAAGATMVPLGAAAACAYVMPALGNPHGRAMSAGAREALLGWARRFDAQLIEDDAYAELLFTRDAGRPLLAHDRARVWHVGTFSKTLCPGLRVGWLVPPRSSRAAALECKRVGDLQSNGLAQSMLEDFLRRDDFDRRLLRARRHYARKARVLLGAMARELPSWRFDEPEGGFSLWARAPEAGDDAALLAIAVHHGVSFDPGTSFCTGAPPETLALRLSFSLESSERIEQGVRRLARAWDQYRRGARRTRFARRA